MSSDLINEIKTISKIYLQSRIVFDQIKNDNKFNADRHLFDVGHFFNENAVVRLAQSLEAGGYKQKLLDNGNTNITLDEAAVGTTILFRNCILHSGGKLEYKPNTFYVPHYNLFCQNYKEAKANIGERLRLSISEVVIKLIEGSLKYVS